MDQAIDSGTAAADNVRPFPGAGAEPSPDHKARSKDRTGAARSKRYRKNRKRGAKRDGRIAVRQSSHDGKLVLGEIPLAEKQNEIKAGVTVRDAPPLVPDTRAHVPTERHGGAAVDLAAYASAVALAGAAAWFSVRGMVVLFPGAPTSVIVMACSMEAAKLITAGWLARRWRTTKVVWRGALVAFVFGLAVINAAGVYAQLVSAHVGERGAATSRLGERTADLGARIDVQAHKVADLDRRLSQIDTTIEEAAKRGRTNAAISAIEGQRKFRGGLVEERNREAVLWQP